MYFGKHKWIRKERLSEYPKETLSTFRLDTLVFRAKEHLVEMSAKFLSELKLVFREPFFCMQEPSEEAPLFKKR